MLGKPVADYGLPSTGGNTFKSLSAPGNNLALCFYLNQYQRFSCTARMARGNGVKPRPGGIELC